MDSAPSTQRASSKRYSERKHREDPCFPDDFGFSDEEAREPDGSVAEDIPERKVSCYLRRAFNKHTDL